MNVNMKLDEISTIAGVVKTMIGLTLADGVNQEQFAAVLYIISDYLMKIVELAEGSADVA